MAHLGTPLDSWSDQDRPAADLRRSIQLHRTAERRTIHQPRSRPGQRGGHRYQRPGSGARPDSPAAPWHIIYMLANRGVAGRSIGLSPTTAAPSHARALKSISASLAKARRTPLLLAAALAAASCSRSVTTSPTPPASSRGVGTPPKFLGASTVHAPVGSAATRAQANPAGLNDEHSSCSCS